MDDVARGLAPKQLKLFAQLEGYGALAVAFSGGVDSALLLAAAKQVLGEGVVAMTAKSPTHPARELDLAEEMAKKIGVKHIIFDTNEMEDAAFAANSPQRCYHCKRVLFSTMKAQARKVGIETIAHGVNLDDLSDFRPGIQAAKELDVAAPLVQAGLTKLNVRQLARQMGLDNWQRPAMACLATRIPYGTPIATDLLARIDTAEEILWRLGVPYCRVRHHGAIARIEVRASDLERLTRTAIRGEIVDQLRALGYEHVCLDLEGYLSGKMNRELTI